MKHESIPLWNSEAPRMLTGSETPYISRRGEWVVAWLSELGF